MIHDSIRSLFIIVLSTALVGCDTSSPARPEPAFADVTFVYTSTLSAGDRDPTEAGFCFHHVLGTSSLELWRDGLTLHETLFMKLDGDPPKAVVRAEQVPAGTSLVAVVWDLQCCSHIGPCWPTEGLTANGVPLSRVVALTVGGERTGLAFRVRGDGTVVP
jgi:hypothetical protein